MRTSIALLALATVAACGGDTTSPADKPPVTPPVVISPSGTWTGVVDPQVLSLTMLESAGAVSGTGTLSNTPTGLRAFTVTGTYVNGTLNVTGIPGGLSANFNVTGTVTAGSIAAAISGGGFSGNPITLYKSGTAAPGAAQWAGTYALVTLDGLPLPASRSFQGYPEKITNRTLVLAADGTGTWQDSSSSALHCVPASKTGPQCDASGRATVAWLATDNSLRVVRSVTTGYVVASKLFVKQPDGSLLKTDDSATEVYRKQ